MHTTPALSMLLALLACLPASGSIAAARNTTDKTPADALKPMPEALEIRYALSALPPALRDAASVYVLDPARGYRLARRGRGTLACMVERTQWEMGTLRDDIYVPQCDDDAGTRTLLKAKMAAAALRAHGMDAATLKTTIEHRFADGTYTAPARPGLSYMVSPVMRAAGPPDLRVHTMAMPHLMFYAPGLRNADIGARPDLADAASLRYPFVDHQGHDAQTYFIQMIGESERAGILQDERALLADLCAYDRHLCLGGDMHH